MIDEEWFRNRAIVAVEAALDPDVPHDPESVICAVMSVAYPTILVKGEDRAVTAILEAVRLELSRITEQYADAADAPAEVYDCAVRLMWLLESDHGEEDGTN